eukprot:235178-Chlamydomonas_euryale.AAC.10
MLAGCGRPHTLSDAQTDSNFLMFFPHRHASCRSSDFYICLFAACFPTPCTLTQSKVGCKTVFQWRLRLVDIRMTMARPCGCLQRQRRAATVPPPCTHVGWGMAPQIYGSEQPSSQLYPVLQQHACPRGSCHARSCQGVHLSVSCHAMQHARPEALVMPGHARASICRCVPMSVHTDGPE